MKENQLSTPTRIEATFAELKSQNRMAFMPFITAGDPDLASTTKVICELAKRGVDLIEVGFPYSDPIADGPVIQASYTRALDKDFHVNDLFAAFKSLTNSDESQTEMPPLVAMVSYAIIFRLGLESFVDQAADAGFAGLIVPDLPADEAAELSQIVSGKKMDLIQLMSPTTPPERAEKILKTASGFVYCISIAGTTGVRDQLPAELTDQLKWLREKTDLPLAVGFGISRPEQVDSLRNLADGIIVGSAIVRQMESLTNNSADSNETLNDIGKFAAEMVAATH